jgi:16S rRNA (cytosine1402-N4)-methyltransferase
MSQSGMSAADVVNRADESELADILYHYGEEKQSRRIARAIIAARGEQPITRTSELTAIVHKAIGKGKPGSIDSATRTFQALRIHVNHELHELEDALAAAEQLLAPGGRLVVVAFHSLEDRIVKQFFQLRCGETGGASRHLPQTVDQRGLPTFFYKVRRALAASEEEMSVNPRARSAKLRYALRTEQPANVRLQ